jgi:predicted kinase
MSDKSLPALTRDADLLAPEKSNSHSLLDNPFINAAAHTLVQTPIDAVAQVVDKTTGSNLLPSLRIVPDAKQAEFGSGDWLQQQAGAAIGALPYLVLLHQGSRAVLSERMLSADTRMMLNTGVKLGTTGTAELARFELATSGLTGAAYGGMFTPVRPQDFNSNFLEAKLKNAALGAGTFMTLSGSMLASKSLSEGLSPGLLKTTLRSDIGSGMLGGLPAGLVNAQGDSLMHGKGFADFRTSAESMIGFSMIGGLMPLAQKGVERILPARDANLKATDVTPAPFVKPVEQVFTPKELATINAWKEAQAKLAETNFRESQPQKIQELADEAYGTGARVKDHKLHILLGNCGAGKSRITNSLAEELGAMTPDSDHIKAKIPGYDKGMGNQAVHEDSSAAYKILLDRALQNGDNIVWQGVGKTAKSVTDLIDQAKSHGYDVVVHMVDAPPEVAAKRVFNRANQEPEPETGVRQMIPPEVPLNPKYQYIPRLNFFKMVGDAAENYMSQGAKTIDGFRLWRSTESMNSMLPIAGTLPALRPGWMPQTRADEQLPNNGQKIQEAMLLR